VVNVAGNGDGTIIFPNKFQANNAIKAGQVVELGSGTDYKFRLKDPGQEKVVAVCKVNGSTRDIAGYTIDPTKQTFATIKNFSAATFRTIEVECGEVQKDAAALDDYQKEPAKVAKIAANETSASTAIIVQVK